MNRIRRSRIPSASWTAIGAGMGLAVGAGFHHPGSGLALGAAFGTLVPLLERLRRWTWNRA